ncbi:MAG: hypothetical protein AMXMBFR7_35970 [Planctomycetota bacterium]
MDTQGVHPAIGISSWSFNKMLFAKQMDLFQVFAAVRGLGVRKVELNNHFFASQEEAYLGALKDAADRYGVRVVNLAVDDKGFDLSSPDEAQRKEAVARTVRWIETAARLDCPFVRNNSGGQDAAACARSFSELAAEARERGRRIAIEAHGGFSSDAAQLLPILAAVREREPQGVALIPDFGNVRITPERDRYAQIEAMAPFAALCHPKMHDFDAFGEQPEWDTQRLVSIVARAGFRGPWIVEFEGQEEAFEGLRKSLVLLSRCLRKAA